MQPLTESRVLELFKALAERGCSIGLGLNDTEIAAVEDAFKAQLPPDLELLLRLGVPSHPEWKLTDWRNPGAAVEVAREWIDDHVFGFDIRQRDYWNKQFGKKPADIDEAVAQAVAVIHEWPALFPIIGHRYLPSSPHQANNPVLSVYYGSDTIYAAPNLEQLFVLSARLDYYAPETFPVVEWDQVGKMPDIPYWGRAFGFKEHT